MRVLEVIHGLGDGGAEAALIRRLSFQPSDVATVVACATELPPHRSSDIEGARVEVVRATPSSRSPSPWVDLLRHVRPEVIVSHSPRETLTLLRAAGRLAAPLVVVCHHPAVTDDPRFRRTKELAFRALNRRAALHVAVSTGVATSAPCRGARRVEVAPLGGKLDSSSAPVPSPWPEGSTLRFMALSRFVGFKNLPALVEAVSLAEADMRSAEAHLAIVGTGPEHDAIRRAIDSRKLVDLVSLHDFVRHPASLLQATDYLVSSSTVEGGPLTLFEAQLAGARVIATPTGVGPDVVSLDPGSLMTEGAHPRQIAKVLLTALSAPPVNPQERADRAAAAARWHVSHTSRHFYDLLRSVVHGGVK